MNPALLGAVQVPDGTVDPFRLTAANMLDAREHGATILTGCEVTGLLREGDRVRGVALYDRQRREPLSLRAQVVVNAAGIWGSVSQSMPTCASRCFRQRIAADPRPPH